MNYDACSWIFAKFCLKLLNILMLVIITMFYDLFFIIIWFVVCSLNYLVKMDEFYFLIQ